MPARHVKIQVDGNLRVGKKNELAVISINKVGKSMYRITKRTGIERNDQRSKY